MSSTAPLLLEQATGFRKAMLEWYRVHQRTLPWRQNPSLYKTVVSEFMLQQTQVKTVLPYFASWLERFPDFDVLAGADEAQVLKAWEGLGYYSRARNLHRLAQAVAAQPAPPGTREGWMALPGIGPYTSAAITSIALEQPHACVDGNVVRILTRLLGDGNDYRDSTTAAKALTPVADALLSPANPGDHNQAMMELGATVCHRQNPLCTICPVLAFCVAGRSGDPEAYPRLAPKKIEKKEVDRIWCVHDGALLLQRTAADARRLANLHELPAKEDLGWSDLPPAAVLLARKRRAITRYQIVESIFRIQTPPRGEPGNRPTLVWVKLAELDEVSLSGPHRRWIQELLKEKNT